MTPKEENTIMSALRAVGLLVRYQENITPLTRSQRDLALHHLEGLESTEDMLREVLLIPLYVTRDELIDATPAEARAFLPKKRPPRLCRNKYRPIQAHVDEDPTQGSQ